MASPLRIIPLGGCGEIGKNMTAFEYGQNILLIDCGIMFPENDMLGIDFIIPDWKYLRDKRDQTARHHRHARPRRSHRRPALSAEGNARPAGLCHQVDARPDRSQAAQSQDARSDAPATRSRPAADLDLGPFGLEFFRVAHSIPDGVGVGITTPAGLVVHTGDFKFDHTPVDGKPTDFAKLAEFGGRGVLALMSDSTNADQPGTTPSERVVDAAFTQVFREAKGRIIVGTFASLISRIQQVANAAAAPQSQAGLHRHQHGGKREDGAEAGLSGSAQRSDRAAGRHQEDAARSGGDHDHRHAGRAIVGAGARRRSGSIRKFRSSAAIRSSCRRIPSPATKRWSTARSIACSSAARMCCTIRSRRCTCPAMPRRKSRKLMLNLVKPEYFIPVHGELRHLRAHEALARQVGIAPQNIFVIENGYSVEFDDGEGRIGERVPGGYVYIDGSGVGDVGPTVLRDREVLGRDGFVIAVLHRDPDTGQLIDQPEIISKGFIHPEDGEDISQRRRRHGACASSSDTAFSDKALRDSIKDKLSEYLYHETKRRPMIIPVLS